MRAVTAPQPVRRVYVLFGLSQLAFGYATGVFDMLYNLHVEQMGVGASAIGFIQLVGLMVMAVACINPLATGAHGDRLRRIMVGSSLCFGATLVLTGLATSFWWQLLVMPLCMACAGTAMTTVTAVVSVVTRSDSLFSMLRWGFVTFLLGQAVANVSCGWLAEYTAYGATRFQITIIVGGVLGALTGLLRMGIGRAGTPPQPGTAEVTAPLRPVGAAEVTTPLPPINPAETTAPLRAVTGAGPDRWFIARIVLLAVLIGAFSALALRLFNLVLVNHYDVSVIGLGYFLALDRLASAAGIFALLPLLRRFGEVRTTGLLLLLVLPLQLLGAFSASALVLMIPHLLRQGIYYSQMPVLDLVTNRNVPDDQKGRHNGFQKFGFFGGGALAAQLYGYLLDQGQIALALIVSGAFAALAGVVYLVLFQRRSPGRRGRPPPPPGAPRHAGTIETGRYPDGRAGRGAGVAAHATGRSVGVRGRQRHGAR